MKTKDSANQNEKNLLEKISPHTRGIIWLSRQEITQRPTGFNIFNYLSNGQLGKRLDDLKESPFNNVHFFENNQFGERFFMIQAVIQSSEKNTLKAFDDILKRKIEEIPQKSKKEFIVFGDYNIPNYVKLLKDSYPQVSFSELKANH